MSISTPPSVFFNGINFNPAFYSIGDEAVTFKFIDANYLRSTNYAISRASYTQFYGIIYALGGISGNGSQLTSLNASNITSGTLTVSYGGIGTTTLTSNQILIGNGTSALLQSANLSWNNISNTLSATNFIGSGSALSALNASNITSGTLTISRGGIGTTTLTSNQILIGNAATSILQTANLTWDNTTNTLSATNFIGSGSALTALNVSNASLGTLTISRGGIGTTTLNTNQILIGNAATSILQSANLSWNNTSNTLSATNFVGSGTGLTALNATNITSGILSISQGGIGASTLSANQILIGNAATSILQSANLTWNNISNTLSATNFVGSGSALTALNVSNASLGTLTISRGGIGTTTLNTNQILIGNAATSILQSANLTWDNTTNTLSATNFIGSGTGLTNLNVSNASSGTLTVSRGGIGTTTLSANQILIGNGTSALLQSANLTWNNTSNTLSATNFIGSGTGLSALNASNVTSGTLTISQGGIGTTTLSANQILIGNGSTSILQSANLSWNNTSNTLSATNFIGSGAGLTNINVSNSISGTLTISRGGIGTTTLSANQLLIGNGSTSILQSSNLTWDNSTNILSASNFVGSGSAITNLNASNISLGTLSISRGGIGTSTLTANQLLIGNGSTSILQSVNLTWDSSNNRLGIGKTNPSTTLDVSNNILCSGSLSCSTLNIGGTDCYNYLFNNSGRNHPTFTDFNTIDKFGYTFIQAATNGPGTGSTQYYSWYIGLGNEYPFVNSVNGYYGMQFAIGRSEAYPKLSVRRKENNVWSAWQGLTSEQAVSLTTGNKTISGNLTVNNITLSSTGKINCVDDYHYIQLNQTNDTLTLQEYGTISFNIGAAKVQRMYINNAEVAIGANFKNFGIANIYSLNPYAVPNNFMAIGSLTIGGTQINYGETMGWSASTAGLMMECADYTEICVHDSGTRLASPMYYNGTLNQIYIGRDKGWGTTNTTISGNGYFSNAMTVYGSTYLTMQSVSNSGTDYVGVQYNTPLGANYTLQLFVMYGTFTGFHRVFTEDEKFNKDDPQKFKDDYVGRIVVSVGKIATDTKINEEWEIKYDKEGITIEDALPMIELSRKKKDKRVFGVLGMPTRQNSRNERLIVNSLGEGAIWVCNSNGNIENGDYITSSDYLGYGEKQEDDLLHNYTVAKATIDCNFELDSPYYNCYEIENELRIAFIACTYHCA